MVTLTEKQQELLNKVTFHTIMSVSGAEYRTAKGLGRISSNPGKSYRGPRISDYSPNGAYYIKPGYVFNQETKSFERDSVAILAIIEKCKKFKTVKSLGCLRTFIGCDVWEARLGLHRDLNDRYYYYGLTVKGKEAVKPFEKVVI